MTILKRIEASSFSDHSYLVEGDECYYYGLFESGGGYSQSDTNSLILNFKKGVERRQNIYEWRHKEKAIRDASKIIAFGISQEWLKMATLVPCPSSKLKSDPLHDDRLLRTLIGIDIGQPLDIRELIIQTKPRKAMHQFSSVRYNPQELMDFWQIDEALTQPEPTHFGVFDDVLTNGTHFRAMKNILTQRFPGCDVVGVFLARVARPKIDFDTLFGD